MDALYTPHNTNPAYQLNWGLTIFWRDANISDHSWFADLQQACEPDGVRILKHQSTTDGASQFFVSTKPNVAPSEIIRRVKGRLQHLVRNQLPKAFRRNYCLRSIGSATRAGVEEYVKNQLSHHPMVDPRVQEMLTKFQVVNSGVDLSQAAFSSHGEYWHNLHVVLVNEDRWMETNETTLTQLLDMIVGSSAKYSQKLSRISILPDHFHLTAGCPVDRSPEEIALSYLNNCASVCGMKPVFKFGYYVGTIGEYDRGAVP